MPRFPFAGRDDPRPDWLAGAGAPVVASGDEVEAGDDGDDGGIVARADAGIGAVPGRGPLTSLHTAHNTRAKNR